MPQYIGGDGKPRLYCITPKRKEWPVTEGSIEKIDPRRAQSNDTSLVI
jgi:hypothetical protein